jgi:hypothetical protein
MIEVALHKVVEKVSLLGPMGRYSLVLRKEGCPVGCAEWLPVSKTFWDCCALDDMIEMRLSRV